MPKIIETPARIEPCMLDTLPVTLTDRIANLTAGAERLGHRLHPQTTANLADLVRVMNCY